MKFNNRGVQISKTAIIGNNVKIGDNTIIYDNVIIEDNTIICNNCVIGEPTGEYYDFEENYQNQKTIIGKNSLIRSHAIIYAGSTFGESFSTGHRVTIRENTVVGDFCRIGTLSDIQGNVILGNYCWLHSNVHVGQKTKLGNFVFVYPYVVFTNDPTPPSNQVTGALVDDFSQIAVHSVVFPGVKIAKHTLIGANTTVTKNTNKFDLIVGNPGKRIKDIREIKVNGKPYYPWPNKFDRGMPWESIGYDKWLKLQDD